MIELSILNLLYLVLTFFIVVIGTLLTLILLRILKILAVGIDMSQYYWKMRKIFMYYSQVPFVVKDKIFDYLAGEKQDKNPSEN